MKTTISNLRTIIYLIILSLSLSLFAQELPQPTLTIESTANYYSAFGNTNVQPIKDQNSSAGSILFAGDFVYPIVSDYGRTILFFQTGYRQRQFSYRDWPSGISRELENIHEITLSGTYRRQFSSEWAVLVNLMAQAASDFKDKKLTSNDMKYTATLVFEKQMNENLSLGFGAAFTSSFGNLLPIPVITLRWDNGDKWSASAYLPSSLDLWYKLSNKIQLGIVATAEGQQYHTSILPVTVDSDNIQLQYISANVGPAVNWKLGSNFSLLLRGGISFQSMSFFDGTKEIKETDFNQDPCGFIHVGTKISF